MAHVDTYEAAELYAAMMGRPEPEDDMENDALESECADRFGIDFLQLSDIAERLLPLCEHRELALSGRSARGFAKNGAFICKVYDDDIDTSEGDFSHG
jgi:hypothetical protein